MRKLRILITLFALALLGALPAAGQTTAFDIEAGYQDVSVNGNEDLYRTQVDEDSGFVLRNLSFTVLDPKAEGFFDRLRIDAAGFGGSPSGRFRMDMGRAHDYNLVLDYNHFENFSALPTLANPFIQDGIIPGQHTFDRGRDMASVELQLMPGRTVTPIIGYRWNRMDGPRTTTVFAGGDEFRLESDLEQTEEELYVGLGFNAGGFTGTLIQGWRTFESEDRLGLAPGAGDGNNSRPVLGTDIHADAYGRTDTAEADTPVTNLFVTGNLLENTLHLQAAFAYADAETEASSSEVLSGSLVSFQIGRFFAGLDETVASTADSPSWRGELRAAYDITANLNIDAGYEMRSTEMDGWALVSSLYTDTLTLGGLEAGDLTRLVEMNNCLQRDQDIADLTVNITDVGPFKFWAGGSVDTQDLSFDEDAAEIVVPGAQEGEYSREVTTYFLGTSVDVLHGTVYLDYQDQDGDAAVMRTDFTARDRARLRIKFPIGEVFNIFATAEQIEADNIDSGVGCESETTHYAAEFDLTLAKALVIRGTWDSFETDSSVSIRRPHDLGIETSAYADDGTLMEGSFDWTAGRFSLSGGYSSLENEGTFLFTLHRVFARFTFDFNKTWGVGLEYDSYDYSEDLFSAADFDAERYGIFIRFRG
jgi:hypothetical protein